MQYEGAGKTDEELLQQAREEYRKHIAPAFDKMIVRRGPGRLTAIHEFQENICEALAGVRKSGQDKLNYAKKQLLDKEMNHPLYHRCERLHESLAIWDAKLVQYKIFLKDLLDPEKYEELVERIEGKWKPLRMIQEHRQELKEVLGELKAQKCGMKRKFSV